MHRNSIQFIAFGRNCSPSLRGPIILLDHVSGISGKRDLNGVE